ncbi:LamG domain-containing protein [Candidatus Poribacteria bacterium]|nr:LamG domain-containing protein [Candidatus Poribacteria bacterium]
MKSVIEVKINGSNCSRLYQHVTKRMLLILICVMFTFTVVGTVIAEFTDGLILYHSYDKGDGDVAEDLSGNGHDGKIDKPEWVDGKFNKALNFGGAGSGTWVTVENTEALNVDTCTFMAWVFAEHWNATRQIVGKSVHGGCTGRGQYGLFSEGGTFKLRFESEGGRSDIVMDLPDTEKWIHVAFTNDGSNGIIYIDGKEAKAGNIPGKLKPNEDPLRIAQDCDRHNNVFAGMIDEVRLWNRALTEQEISTYMDQGVKQALSVSPSAKISTTWAQLKHF